MKFSDKIPVLSMMQASEKKKLYGIQKICKYDDADEVILLVGLFSLFNYLYLFLSWGKFKYYKQLCLTDISFT